MLYNIVLVSAIHQHESAVDIRMSPPSEASLSPPTPSHSSKLSQSPSLSSLKAIFVLRIWDCRKSEVSSKFSEFFKFYTLDIVFGFNSY